MGEVLNFEMAKLAFYCCLSNHHTYRNDIRCQNFLGKGWRNIKIGVPGLYTLFHVLGRHVMKCNEIDKKRQ